MQCNALNIKTTAKQVLVVLYSQNYAAGIRGGHYHESSDRFEYPKKSLLKSPLKSSHKKKKILAKFFYPQKIPESKISNPKKSFDYPRHLKSGELGPIRLKARLQGRFLSRNSMQFFVALKLQLQNRACKPAAISVQFIAAVWDASHETRWLLSSSFTFEQAHSFCLRNRRALTFCTYKLH